MISRIQFSAFAIFCSALLVPMIDATSMTRVKIEVTELGTSCSGYDKFRSTVAGSMGVITVTVTPTSDHDLPFTGFSETPPSWLALEFGYGSHENFMPSQSLKGLLEPKYYLDDPQVRTNEYWQQGRQLEKSDTYNFYFFSINVPEELGGESICIRAVLKDPPYGPIVMDHFPNQPPPIYRSIDIISPCTREDSILSIESLVACTYKMRDFERTITLTDSLTSIGWRVGYHDARSAARRLGRFDDMLRFFDLIYETDGTVIPNFSGGSLKSHDEEERFYNESRRGLLKWIVDQKQEQQR